MQGRKPHYQKVKTWDTAHNKHNPLIQRQNISKKKYLIYFWQWDYFIRLGILEYDREIPSSKQHLQFRHGLRC